MLEQVKKFNNLKIHTQYSICEGAIKIDELAEYCKLNKIKAIGLTDSHNLCGALEFAEKISKVGTQPIIGTQINILSENQIGKVTLYAISEKGYKNLTKLSSISYLKKRNSNEPYCEIQEIISNSDDLILLTGNYKNFFGKLFYANKIKLLENIFEKFKLCFKNRLYIEIQRHGEDQESIYENYLLNMSSLYGLPIIASQEIFYLNPDMAEAHDALICIGEKNFVDDPNRYRYSDQHYLKKNEELIKLFSDLPEALENNYNFPLRFNFKPKKSKPILPSIFNQEGMSAEKELMSQAKEGLENRIKNFILKKNKKKKCKRN